MAYPLLGKAKVINRHPRSAVIKELDLPSRVEELGKTIDCLASLKAPRSEVPKSRKPARSTLPMRGGGRTCVTLKEQGIQKRLWERPSPGSSWHARRPLPSTSTRSPRDASLLASGVIGGVIAGCYEKLSKF